MNAPAPPHPVGTPPKDVDIHKMLIPWWHDGAPYLLEMPGSEAVYLPCFSSADIMKECLGATMRDGDALLIDVKMIDDVREFLLSVPSHVKVILDPRVLPDDRVTFTEVLRD